jgi:ABC-type ATPase with predicted acetyltransferase domain
MRRVFISQPMRGKSDWHITHERERALMLVKRTFNDEAVEVIDTFFKGYNGNRLEFLGKSVMEGLAKADVAVFVGDWQNYDGCRCVHFIASQYKVPCFYVDTEVAE